MFLQLKQTQTFCKDCKWRWTGYPHYFQPGLWSRSRRFLDGVGVGILRVLVVGVGIFDSTPPPLSPIELIFNMLCLFIFTSPASLTFDLAWWC